MTDDPRFQSDHLVWVVAPRVGTSSETWLWRQLRGFAQVRPVAFAWGRENPDVYPLSGIPFSIVPFAHKQDVGLGRAWRRLLAWPSGNYCKSASTERRWFLAQARSSAPSAMLCHFGHTALRMLPVARELDIPVIAHFHGLDLSSSLQNKWYRWSLEDHLHSFAKLVVVGSHQYQFLLDKGVPSEKLSTIPCGVPVEEFLPVSREASNPVQFVAVSRLTEFKGLDVSLRAFAFVRQTIHEARFVIIGEGPEASSLQSLANALGIVDAVRFMGARPESEVRETLHNSDVFVQHSRTGRNGWVEGFGVSIAEAAACALPVVVTDCGGIPDQVVNGHTGFITREGDIEQFGQAMLALGLDAGLRKKLGQAGRDNVVRHFDTAGQVKKLESIILGSLKEV